MHRIFLLLIVMAFLCSCSETLYSYKWTKSEKQYQREKVEELSISNLNKNLNQVVLSRSYISAFSLKESKLIYSVIQNKGSYVSGKRIKQLHDKIVVSLTVYENTVYIVAHDPSDRSSERIYRVRNNEPEAIGIPAFRYSEMNYRNGKLCFSCRETERGEWKIWIMNDDASEPYFVCKGKNPSWGDDGKIYFEKKLTAGETVLCRINPDSSAEEQLLSRKNTHFTNVRQSAGKLLFVKDGRNICLKLENVPDIYQITQNYGRDDLPLFSMDGKFIYFRSTRNQHWGIWKCSVEKALASPTLK